MRLAGQHYTHKMGCETTSISKSIVKGDLKQVVECRSPRISEQMLLTSVQPQERLLCICVHNSRRRSAKLYRQ